MTYVWSIFAALVAITVFFVIRVGRRRAAENAVREAAEAERQRELAANPHLNLKDAIRTRIPTYEYFGATNAAWLDSLVDRLQPSAAEAIATSLRSRDPEGFRFQSAPEFVLASPSLRDTMSPLNRVLTYLVASRNLTDAAYDAIRRTLTEADAAALATIERALCVMHAERTLQKLDRMEFLIALRDLMATCGVQMPFPVPTREEWEECKRTKAKEELAAAFRGLESALLMERLRHGVRTPQESRRRDGHRTLPGKATDLVTATAMLPINVAGEVVGRTGKFAGDVVDAIFDPFGSDDD